MRRWFILAAALGGIGIGTFLCLSMSRRVAQFTGTPGNLLTPQRPSLLQKRNLGVISPRGSRDISFTVRNPLTRDLEITAKETSCGCLSFQETPGVIRAGSGVEVFLTLDPTGKKGPFTGFANLETSDPELPVIALKIEGIAEGLWSSRPLLDLGTVRVGEECTDDIHVYLVDTDRHRFVGAMPRSDECRVELVPPPSAVVKTLGPYVTSVAVRVRWTPAKVAAAALSTGVDITTTSSKFPSLHIPVIGQLADPEDRVSP